MNVTPFGISKLDALTGGIQEGYNVVFTGLPGTAKSLFIHKIVYSLLERGFTVLFVTTDRSPEQLINEVSNLGMNYSKYLKSKKLILIDVYAGKASLKNNLSVDIRDLTRLSLLIDETVKGLNDCSIVEVYDVLTELFVWTPNQDLILQFISNVCSKTRENGLISLLVINEGAQKIEYINSIKAMADGVVSFGFDDDHRFVKIDKMKGVPVKAGKNYFNVNSKNGLISFPVKKGK